MWTAKRCSHRDTVIAGLDTGPPWTPPAVIPTRAARRKHLRSSAQWANTSAAVSAVSKACLPMSLSQRRVGESTTAVTGIAAFFAQFDSRIFNVQWRFHSYGSCHCMGRQGTGGRVHRRALMRRVRRCGVWLAWCGGERGGRRCYAARQSTSFNDPSREAEKEVKISHGCLG